MNEANTPDNGAYGQSPLSENTTRQDTSHYASCPFNSVLSNQNLQNQDSQNQNPEISQEILKLPPARSQQSDSQPDLSESQAKSPVESEIINNSTHRDSDFHQVLTLGNEQWESKIIRDNDLLEVKSEVKSEEAVSEKPDISPQDDWVAEPDRNKLALIDAEFQQLLVLNHELRTANSDLYNRVEELTSKLSDSEKSVQLQQKRYKVTESMLKEQTQELCAAQEQVRSLYQQLENSLQNIQRQEALIETYKAQLEFSQQRLAQLERECALLQTNHNEQSQHLFQSENTCRELRTRLMRQQRQTLQFKAALEKCLDPTPSSEISDEREEFPVDSSTNQQSPFLKKFKSLFVNAQPIKPWSSESFGEDAENNREEISSTHQEVPSSTFNPPFNISESETQSPQPTAESVELKGATSKSSDVSSGSPSLEEQIDSVIQMFFTSQSSEVTSSGSTSPEFNMGEFNHEFEKEELSTSDSIWDTVSNSLDSAIYSEKDDANDVLINASSEKSITPEIVIEPNSQLESQSKQPLEEEDYWAEVSQLTNLELPATESPFHPANTDEETSPSPVVFPNRPPKGRKSLASVELPKFRSQ
ncbi:hypothetical protein [Brunnivagina elsteri]|uniref:Uncharacterized protein n=1 Tax=Brunnivagina elsteri CCALA 953 TaxID=987040 RepID=A0A2A2TFD0_9CYAN|nr:hypothetical protein [Calothrix elsteri]PAX52442.1 hypothetical protein CK510_19285 [Calothrix elsteri CCALA 953]